jgi:cobalt-zinc-cadmium efflux system outer membrane protein
MERAICARRGVAAALFILFTTGVSAASAQEALRLDAALARAREGRPEFRAAAAEQRALDAATRQAALPPNPELSLEVEDVAGSGEFSGVNEAQTTLRVLQPIELGGDRRARRTIAERQRDLASYDAEARRLDILSETASAFVAVLIAQEEVHHAGELVDLAVREARAASERVSAGAALGVEETRARFAESEARLHESNGRLALDAARRRLAASWGDVEPDFSRAEGDLENISPPPPIEELLAKLERNPDLARFEAERAERDAQLALARARRIPDPRLGAGVRHLAGPGDAALVFEVAVPLPLFDRQQGAIAEAAERIAKLDAERAAARRTARAALVAEHARWTVAHGEVEAVRDRLLPGAKQALAELRSAHRAGRISQLDALAAWRTEFETVDRMLHQLGEYHEARIATQRLVGASADQLP